ncbi:MAG TPA: heme exporter protein CcmD [Roseococcus sp.]|jgi:heme exporter protein CcmD|nr:heme exporter protein CcmD [Roseococcus sp.]
MNTAHWWFIGLSWALTLIIFGALAVAALLRHRNAKRQLARLETRARGKS